ncbi:MAG: double zinc ribbon domain-containing protein [Clostridiales bacterium]|nr:double zinc ribbon domain-containing protein [Clostridiales bacterium]
MRTSEFAERLKKALFPARCMICNKVTSDGRDICSVCETSAAYISGDCCEYCGCEKKYCTCRKKKNNFEKIYAPFYYEYGIKEAVHRFKFGGKRWLRAPMSRHMAERAADQMDISAVDVVTCVPFTAKQLKKRGYNQSGLLAKDVAKRLGLSFEGELLAKLYETAAQHRTARENRAGNVMGVFDVPQPEKVTGKTILLCDDVKTTGATLDECAKMLILNGAEKVYGLCLAIPRAERPGKERQETWQD